MWSPAADITQSCESGTFVMAGIIDASTRASWCANASSIIPLCSFGPWPEVVFTESMRHFDPFANAMCSLPVFALKPGIPRRLAPTRVSRNARSGESRRGM